MRFTSTLRRQVVTSSLGLVLLGVNVSYADQSTQGHTGTEATEVSPEDRALARELGVQAFEAFDAGDFVTAETLFARAISLYPAPTLRLGRARALERSGRLVAAAEEYRSLLRSAPAPGEPASFAEARASAKQELEALIPRLGQLTVQLRTRDGAALPPFTLAVDDRLWPVEAIGVPRPFDPGQHQVRLTLEDARTIERTVTLTEGSVETLVLQLPSQGPAVAGATATPPVEDSPRPVDALDDRVLVTGITTGVLTVAAIVTGFVALSKRSAYDDKNRPDVPSKEKQGLRTSAQTWSWVNTGLSVAAVAGAGLTWYFYSESEQDTEQRESGWGVQFSGTF